MTQQKILRQAGFAPITVLLILAVLILGGGVVVYQNVLAPKVNPTPSPIVSPSPILTPTFTTTPSSLSQPSPTPDLTADWKTYNNISYHFFIKYPRDWQTVPAYNKDPTRAYFFSYPEPPYRGYDLMHNPPSGGMDVDIYAFVVSPTDSLDSLVQDSFSKSQRITGNDKVNPIKTKVATTIAGLSGIKAIDGFGDVYIFLRNNAGSTLAAVVARPAVNEKVNQEVFDQILSTFKFLD